ncbi:calcium/sodium antiporter [Endothiovibrio diazotrophicus]
MLLSITAVLIGFALLVWGADRFVAGASATARNLGVSPLVIGLTIVGFGTSAPEMLVSGVAAMDGNPGLGIGNAVGSNITNIGLVLGTTALIYPLSVHSQVLSREFPVLFVIMMVSLLLLADGDFSRIDGLLLLAGMGVLGYWMVATALRSREGAAESDPLADEYEAEIPADMSMAVALIWLAVGLLVLLGSSKLLVWGAVAIAHSFGVSDLVIGLTIVAIGTSLPELAASVMGAMRGEHDVAIGNVIGSNMFNLLAVLGLPGALAPGAVDPDVLARDYPVMIGLTIALFATAYGFRGAGRINRIEGALLLAVWIGYQGYLYHTV